MKNSRILHQTEPPVLYRDLVLFLKIKGLEHKDYSRKKFPFEIEGAKVYRLPIICSATHFVKHIK